MAIDITTLFVPMLIAATAGLLGCFVVWRKMSYFGDSLSHSAMLGIALGVATGISESISIIIICVLFSILLIWIQEKKLLANDTILGIFAHAGLSIGMLAMALLGGQLEHDHEHEILFGDLTKITGDESSMIIIAAITIVAVIYMLWGRLLMATINEDIARAEGINTFTTQLILVGLVTFVVAASVEIVGIFLITALMIIPAATARQISRSPRQMALFSGIVGVISVLVGVSAAQNANVPDGPAIVVTSTILLISAMIIGSAIKRN